jgi:hypothetical protein
MTNPSNDPQRTSFQHEQANAWFRLLLVMAAPVLLLLIVIFLSR